MPAPVAPESSYEPSVPERESMRSMPCFETEAVGVSASVVFERVTDSVAAQSGPQELAPLTQLQPGERPRLAISSGLISTKQFGRTD